MFGKSLVIKILGISNLMFNFMVLDVDDCKIKETNRILYSFLWNKRERIQRNTLIGDILKGGIAMIDVECKINAMKAGWKIRILPEQKWSDVIKTRMSEMGFKMEMLIKCNFSSVKLFPSISMLPEFYQQVFVNFNKCKGNPMRQCKDIFSEIIWGNQRFKHKNECLYIGNWIKSGIIYVKDLIYDDKFITSEKIFALLKSKVNWISEYVKVKKVFSNILNNVDLQQSKYVNIKPMIFMYNLGNQNTDVRT